MEILKKYWVPHKFKNRNKNIIIVFSNHCVQKLIFYFYFFKFDRNNKSKNKESNQEFRSLFEIDTKCNFTNLNNTSNNIISSNKL